MNQHHNHEVILIDLDALLDTRAAVLGYLNPQWMESVLMDEKNPYRLRTSDFWNDIKEGIDTSQYEEVYKNRDKKLLSLARMTNIVPYLLDIVREQEGNIAFHSDVLASLTIVINTFPYELTKEETHDLIMAMTSYFGLVVDVKVFHEDPMNLPLNYLTYKGFTQYVMYDFKSWSEKHVNTIEKLENYPARPQFMIITPQLMSYKLTPELLMGLEEHNLVGEDPFEIMKSWMAPIFTLIFLPPGAFSLLELSAHMGS